MMKLFATKVSSFTIVIKSCILIGRIQNELLFDQLSNGQLLGHLVFLFFKFWIILAPSCNSFKCTRIPTGNATSLLWNCAVLYLRLTYPQTVLFLLQEYKRGGLKECFNFFGTIYTFSNRFALSKAKKWLTFIILSTFFDKQFAKNNRTLWIKSVLNNFFPFLITANEMNKFFYCMYLKICWK